MVVGLFGAPLNVGRTSSSAFAATLSVEELARAEPLRAPRSAGSRQKRGRGAVAVRVATDEVPAIEAVDLAAP